MAQQALTAQVATRGRFTLGIGLSHAFVMRTCLGSPMPNRRGTCGSISRCSCRS
jgi:hypothetical protein